MGREQQKLIQRFETKTTEDFNSLAAKQNEGFEELKSILTSISGGSIPSGDPFSTLKEHVEKTITRNCEMFREEILSLNTGGGRMDGSKDVLEELKGKVDDVLTEQRKLETKQEAEVEKQKRRSTEMTSKRSKLYESLQRHRGAVKRRKYHTASETRYWVHGVI